MRSLQMTGLKDSFNGQPVALEIVPLRLADDNSPKVAQVSGLGSMFDCSPDQRGGHLGWPGCAISITDSPETRGKAVDARVVGDSKG
jgi:hypothetical protein